MNIFEFQFNPKLRKDAIFESFCYEPENEQERMLGSLYIVAEIQDVDINASQLLNNLASIIKQEYYSDFSQTPEKNFKKALKKANEFLIKKAKINLTIFAVSEQQQIHLSKRGSIHIIISREKEIQEISQKPSKTIENITSGELLENDKIMVFTEQVLDFFEDNNLIEKISSVKKKKEINKILKEHKKALSKISGIFFLIILKPTMKKKPECLSYLTNLAIASQKILGGLASYRKPDLNFLDLNFLKIKIKSVIFSKKLILVFLLILILAVGSLAFKNEKEKEIQRANQSLEEIKEKVEQAENFLIIKDEAKANLFFQEAWKSTIPLTETRFILKDEALVLKESIEEQLYLLNKTEEIKEPTISEDFAQNKFGSEEIIYRSKAYSLNPATGEIIKEGKIWGKSEKLINGKSMAVDGSVWVLDNENKILRFYTGKYQDTLEIIIFPEIENATKIWASYALPYIYILEPYQKRIIVVNKSGELIKQFFSEKFDDLQDFIISTNGKTIWLLNGSKVYQIEFY
ncbi:MAG: hypothetical protein WBC21_01920 [Minisyncoccales bacterium]